MYMVNNILTIYSGTKIYLLYIGRVTAEINFGGAFVYIVDNRAGKFLYAIKP